MIKCIPFKIILFMLCMHTAQCFGLYGFQGCDTPLKYLTTMIENYMAFNGQTNCDKVPHDKLKSILNAAERLSFSPAGLKNMTSDTLLHCNRQALELSLYAIKHSIRQRLGIVRISEEKAADGPRPVMPPQEVHKDAPKTPSSSIGKDVPTDEAKECIICLEPHADVVTSCCNQFLCKETAESLQKKSDSCPNCRRVGFMTRPISALSVHAHKDDSPAMPMRGRVFAAKAPEVSSHIVSVRALPAATSKELDTIFEQFSTHQISAAQLKENIDNLRSNPNRFTATDFKDQFQLIIALTENIIHQTEHSVFAEGSRELNNELLRARELYSQYETFKYPDDEKIGWRAKVLHEENKYNCCAYNLLVRIISFIETILAFRAD